MKIPGKLREEDLPQLVDLVRGKGVLMLGCYCGRALTVVARHARRVWVLDDFRYFWDTGGIVEELKANVDRCVPEEARIDLLYGTVGSWGVPSGADDLDPSEVEVVYRDADRRGSADGDDGAFALGVLRGRGGVYAWHGDDGGLKWLRVDPVPVEVN